MEESEDVKVKSASLSSMVDDMIQRTCKLRDSFVVCDARYVKKLVVAGLMAIALPEADGVKPLVVSDFIQHIEKLRLLSASLPGADCALSLQCADFCEALARGFGALQSWHKHDQPGEQLEDQVGLLKSLAYNNTTLERFAANMALPGMIDDVLKVMELQSSGHTLSAESLIQCTRTIMDNTCKSLSDWKQLKD